MVQNIIIKSNNIITRGEASIGAKPNQISQTSIAGWFVRDGGLLDVLNVTLNLQKEICIGTLAAGDKRGREGGLSIRYGLLKQGWGYTTIGLELIPPETGICFQFLSRQTSQKTAPQSSIT